MWISFTKYFVYYFPTTLFPYVSYEQVHNMKQFFVLVDNYTGTLFLVDNYTGTLFLVDNYTGTLFLF